MKTAKQILSLAAAAAMLSAASAQQPHDGTSVQEGGGKTSATVVEAQQPLVIVEGRGVIDIEGLKEIKPSQIESISVLKNASAEKYASLGDVSNGVIIVVLYSDDEECYTTADEMPTFLGGDLNTFRQWAQQQVRYPEYALDNNIQGNVVAKFVIGKDGLVESGIEILDSPDASLSEEVIRILKNSPTWAPGRNDGKNVRVAFVLPISFRTIGSSDDSVELKSDAESVTAIKIKGKDSGQITITYNDEQLIDDIVVIGFKRDKNE